MNDIPLAFFRTNTTNKDTWKQIVKDLLGSSKLNALKQNGEELDTYLYFKPDGKIIFAF